MLSDLENPHHPHDPNWWTWELYNERYVYAMKAFKEREKT